MSVTPTLYNAPFMLVSHICSAYESPYHGVVGVEAERFTATATTVFELAGIIRPMILQARDILSDIPRGTRQSALQLLKDIAAATPRLPVLARTHLGDNKADLIDALFTPQRLAHFADFCTEAQKYVMQPARVQLLDPNERRYLGPREIAAEALHALARPTATPVSNDVTIALASSYRSRRLGSLQHL